MLLALGTWASRLRDTRASLPRTCDHVRPRHPGAVAPAPPASRTRTPHARRPSGSADGTPWGATGDAGLRATAPLSALLSVDRPRLGPVFVEAALQPRRGPQDQRRESARARPQHMDHPCSQRHRPPPMPRTARRRRRAAPDTASNPPHRHMELMCRRKAQALPRAALQRAHRRAAVPCGADSCANGDDDGLVVCGGVSSMS